VHGGLWAGLCMQPHPLFTLLQSVEVADAEAHRRGAPPSVFWDARWRDGQGSGSDGLCVHASSERSHSLPFPAVLRSPPLLEACYPRTTDLALPVDSAWLGGLWTAGV
jgi:hypothetical protein